MMGVKPHTPHTLNRPINRAFLDIFVTYIILSVMKSSLRRIAC